MAVIFILACANIVAHRECVWTTPPHAGKALYALKMHVDSTEFTPGKFILTGSSQFRLKQNMTDSMAGRVSFLKLLPFSFRELREEDILPENPYDIIFEGQYPPLHDPEKHFIPEDWYESYIDTYLDLDVRDQINTDNLSTFKRFIQVCAVYSGQLLSMDSIARDVGVSAPTIKNGFLFWKPHSSSTSWIPIPTTWEKAL